MSAGFFVVALTWPRPADQGHRRPASSCSSPLLSRLPHRAPTTPPPAARRRPRRWQATWGPPGRSPGGDGRWCRQAAAPGYRRAVVVLAPYGGHNPPCPPRGGISAPQRGGGERRRSCRPCSRAGNKCPPEGGVKGPQWKNSAREGGRRQSAGELRSPLSRCGFAFAPDSTPLGACGPQNRLEAVSAPPLGYPERGGPRALRLEKEGGEASAAAPEPLGDFFSGLARGRVGLRRCSASIAAMQTGRQAYAAEINPDYFQVAASRLRGEFTRMEEQRQHAA